MFASCEPDYDARDDLDGAWAECEKALNLARATNDPQLLAGTLGEAAEIYAHAGRVVEAKAFVDEIMSHPATAQVAIPSIAWAAEWIGLEPQEFEEFEASLNPALQGVWRRFGELVLAGEFEKVAGVCVEMGLKDYEAEARLRAAKRSGRQRQDDANAELERRLSFSARSARAASSAKPSSYAPRFHASRRKLLSRRLKRAQPR